MDPRIDQLQKKIDVYFKQPELLRTAVTHPSYLAEHPDEKQHNQRLEFLGDAILGAAVLEGKKILEQGLELADGFPVLIGFVVAAVSGFFAIKLLVNLINKRKLHYFSYYCWGAGILIILYSLVLH